MDKSKEIQRKERQQQKAKSTAIQGDKKLNGPNRPST
ncbi:spore protein [Oceanobacillus piezotolerans]|nr:spore protein [Oceanobacillus piezotolerans]